MQITQLWAQSLVAIFGGLACELLHWYSLSRKPSGAARFAHRPVYWITTLGMILLAGAMPLLYLQGTSTALLGFHLGAATPILLSGETIAYSLEEEVRMLTILPEPVATVVAVAAFTGARAKSVDSFGTATTAKPSK